MSYRVVTPVNIAGMLESVATVVAAELEAAAVSVKAEAVRRVVDADKVDTGDLLRGISDPIRADESATLIGYDVLSQAAHSLYVELGRRPGGRMPPHEVIHAWVKRRLGLADPEADRAAWAIAKHIAQNGIAGIHFMRGAADSVDADALARRITEALNR